LLGLGAEKSDQAIGIAATQAAGLKSMFGTMCKPLHAGRAASSGLLAARLARRGFTSAENALGRPQGFALTLGNGIDLEVLESRFGEPWYILGNLFKLHAACYFTHAAIEAMFTLTADRVSSDDVEHIELRVPPQHLDACNIATPTTGLEAKFSLRFAAAQALLSGRADESAFTDEMAIDPRIRALLERVEVVADETLGIYDTVAIVDGRGQRWTVAKNTSSPAWRTTPDDQTPMLVSKFHSLVDPIFGPSSAEAVVGAVMGLEDLTSAEPLMRLLKPQPVAV
jgi:2-methylcitrate dehydratase PrpD